MSDVIDGLNQALEGRYRIERELGAGGMATVYLADDLKHERKVALKVLRPELAAVVGAERFLAEIRTTANLQHPHILPLFDSGQAGSFLFYVMPYVEGETLRDRLDREHQLPVADAVRIARDVAEALEYAHTRGVIHRDIKPANILIQASRPVIADFGIALAVGAAGGGRLTETGLSVGTPHYMSPEQATGDVAVGPAADIYALGCVLYEMLVGEPPHTGSNAQAILGKIITGHVAAPTEHRASVPAHVDAAIRRALERVPADRFRRASEFADALGDPGFRHGPEAAGVGTGGRSLWNPLSTSAVALSAILLALAGWSWVRSSPSPEAPPVPFRSGLTDFEPFDPFGGVGIAISRDGSKIATLGRSDGEASLFVRSLDELSYREIPGSVDANNPTFSPNGRWLAFDQDGRIKRTEVSGGPVYPVVEGEDAHWGTDDLMVFVTADGIWGVNPTGGDPSLILSVDSLPGGNMRNTRPQLLPDGRAVLFQSTDFATDAQRVMMVEVATGTVTDLGIDGSNPRYAATGHIVYGFRSEPSSLRAVPFDLSTREVTGEPATVLLEVTVRGGGATQFVVSETGTAFYGLRGRRVFSVSGGSERLMVVELDGTESPVPLEPRDLEALRWSPDGESVAYQSTPESGTRGQEQIFVYNVALRTGPRQLTFDGRNRSPVWSPDGSRLVFASERDGTQHEDLYVKTMDDLPPELLLTLPEGQFPTQWPRDDLIVFEEFLTRGDGDADVWMLELGPDSAVARPYFESEAEQRDLMISPTGALAAYRSNESGTAEIYVRGFPTARRPELVSRGGGTNPFWSPDGRTLYYWTIGFATDVKSLVAARIDPGPPFTVVSTEAVLTAAYRSDSADLHPDGDRIIVAQDTRVDTDIEQPLGPPRFLVVTNWFEELREMLRGG